MSIVAVGIDLAKNVFAIHGVDAAGKAVLVRPNVARSKLLEVMASLPPCRVGMKACSGAHHWARELIKLGHDARIMAPKFVAPYRMGGKYGKNDAADAAAICEAVQRPNMRFVPAKSIEQQSQLMVHRARQGYVQERTALINRIRGLLSELNHLDERIAEYDGHIAFMARHIESAQRLMQLPGIGATTASAISSSIGNGHDFKNGRQFAAWLGLTLRQYCSGGKARLGRITKAGDSYLRNLLVLGARSVLQAALRDASPKPDKTSCWARRLHERRGYWRAVVAIAAKNARLCWTMLRLAGDFKMPA